MEPGKYSVGLDIGTTKIVAIIGKENEYGKIEVLGIGKSKSLGVHRGVVNNITQTIKSIQQAVEEAEATSGLKISSVVVGIAGQHIRSLQHSDYITRPDSEQVINEDDVDILVNQVYKLIMLPGEEIIHVLPQEYKVDGQAEIKEPIGMYGGRLEANFHVVVGQVSSIKNVGRCIKSAGLDLGSITLEPLASANAVLSQEEKEAGIALIDIGGGTTDVAIFKDGIIRHTAVIPFGGNVITEDIKEGCSIIEKQAELLKIKFGSAWPGENKDNEIVSIPGLRGREPKEITLKNLSKIIHARVVEIIEQVYMEIKNYGHEDQKKKLIGGIVLTGGGSQLKHLKQLVEYITGMDTRIGYPNEHLAGDSTQDIASPLYATGVGLLMNAIETNAKNKEIALEEAQAEKEAIVENNQTEEGFQTEEPNTTSTKKEVKPERKSIFEKWSDKLKDFLDNAE
ncbi:MULTISPECIES: cell division protein FtsA [Cellulophaga]|uniref:Cell division protein FtsA n=2 Tax=Cellulophaga TaxID=104264 RepID=F0RDT6_CELLC|nr:MULTISPECIES: cell division protein FtsA [Cellulophaga]ADY29847.1 cell division protein FtsA [Cellulophaga lytica DSM 7489]AIM60846.1 cell division protein FtsA [Cellulophaga lytica]APU10716.1 cell division protein FtsA [Cellulophaga lytica]EWH15105.1 cell division protein FtsA [Cellulophaga geojensis KL-A]MDO6854551.1 cell division protein FtsA [Cellulophaga lytica]